jgi:hypothetical protein
VGNLSKQGFPQEFARQFLALQLPLLAALTLFFFFCVAALPFLVLLTHNDLGWHIAAGDLILANMAIPSTDPWSYSSAGHPWTNLAWAWDVIASVVYRHFRIEGLLILSVAVGGLCLVLVHKLALRLGSTPLKAASVALLALMALPFYGIPDIFLPSSPQLAGYLLLLVLLLVLGRPTFRIWIPPFLLLLWVNLHNSFPLGLVILALYAGEAIRQKSPELGRLCAALLLSALAVLLNPFGIDAYLVIWRTFGHVSQSHISEWQPFHTLLSGPFRYAAWPVLLFFAAYVYALWRVWRKEILLPAPHIVLSLLLLVLAVLQYRYVSVWLLVSAPLLVAPSYKDLPPVGNQPLALPSGASPTPTLRWGAEVQWLLFFLIVILVFPRVLLSQFPFGVKPAGYRYPSEALQHIAKNYPKAKVANQWNYGSWMILYHRDQMRPMIDGRALTAYPDSFFEDYYAMHRASSTQGWQDFLKRHPADLVLWPTADQKMVPLLRSMPGWRQVYGDSDALIFAPLVSSRD